MQTNNASNLFFIFILSDSVYRSHDSENAVKD